MKVHLEDVVAAAARLENRVHRTPILRSRQLDELGPVSSAERRAVGVFGLAIAGWLTSTASLSTVPSPAATMSMSTRMVRSSLRNWRSRSVTSTSGARAKYG